MTKTYTIPTDLDNKIYSATCGTTTTYTIRDCTAVSSMSFDNKRSPALYLDYYDESGEHVDYVIFDAKMPESEEEFEELLYCPNASFDWYYVTLASVCFEDGVNIDESVNAAAARIRNAKSLADCDDAVATICERAGMLHALTAADADHEAEILLQAANILGVDIQSK